MNQAAEAVVEVICPDQPILQITDGAAPQSVPPGGVITYTIVISNAGNIPQSA